MTKSINQKIASVAVKSDGATEPGPSSEQTTAAGLQIDVLDQQIPRREEGELESVTVKESFYSQDGRQTIYFTVSFTPIEGWIEGEWRTIERPMEIFLPVGQFTSNWAWMSSNMRLLSLLARAGDLPRALKEMRKVVWDKGPVRCGTNRFDKPIYHDSDVAAIAWMIQQTLIRRRFLNPDTLEPYAPEVLAFVFENRHTPIADDSAIDSITQGDDDTGIKTSMRVGDCPDCGGDLILMDGCPTCAGGCGYSKC